MWGSSNAVNKHAAQREVYRKRAPIATIRDCKTAVGKCCLPYVLPDPGSSSLSLGSSSLYVSCQATIACALKTCTRTGNWHDSIRAIYIHICYIYSVVLVYIYVYTLGGFPFGHQSWYWTYLICSISWTGWMAGMDTRFSGSRVDSEFREAHGVLTGCRTRRFRVHRIWRPDLIITRD